LSSSEAENKSILPKENLERASINPNFMRQKFVVPSPTWTAPERELLPEKHVLRDGNMEATEQADSYGKFGVCNASEKRDSSPVIQSPSPSFPPTLHCAGIGRTQIQTYLAALAVLKNAGKKQS
jgi:hypothetical protein